MLFREIIAIWCLNRTEHVDADVDKILWFVYINTVGAGVVTAAFYVVGRLQEMDAGG